MPQSVMFLYWGRRGLSQFALAVIEAALRAPDLSACISVSRQNELFPRFAALGEAVVPVDTFARGIGAACLWRIPPLRNTLREAVRTRRVAAVVNLMPHVWSPFVQSAARQGGARYYTVVHDAARHPGDATGLVHGLLMRDARTADGVFTLSRAVAERLAAEGRVDPARLTTLFHPNLWTGGPPALAAPPAGEPWRLLFLGRIMAYKGLPLLVEAAERLAAQGRPVHLSVMGEGDLGALRGRLDRLGAEVANRWLGEEEIAATLASHHLVVLPYREASQSGVAAAALGAGVPVVATPVGGLAEQVVDGETGLVARAVSAEALADAVDRLTGEPGLHARMSRLIRERADRASPDRFLALMRESLAAPLPAARR